MTAIVVSIAAVVGLWLARRGFRRGALATVLAWLPTFAAVFALLTTMRVAWTLPEHFGVVCLLGGAAAVVLFVAGTFAGRRKLRSLIEKRRTASADTGASVARLTDRLAGAVLGVIHAAVLCLGAACLASALSFAVSLPSETTRHAEPAEPRGQWAGALERACGQMADIANFGVLRHIPGIREHGREIRALITVLNAPEHKLRLVAERRGFAKLLAVPAVQEAIEDKGYLELVAGVGRGDLAGLPRLARSPITKKLLACPEVRAFTENLKPSQLAADLQAIADDKDVKAQCPMPKPQ